MVDRAPEVQNGVELITIPAAEYKSLLDSEFELACLEDAGVDNWCGYEMAMEAYGADDED